MPLADDVLDAGPETELADEAAVTDADVEAGTALAYEVRVEAAMVLGREDLLEVVGADVADAAMLIEESCEAYDPWSTEVDTDILGVLSSLLSSFSPSSPSSFPKLKEMDRPGGGNGAGNFQPNLAKTFALSLAASITRASLRTRGMVKERFAIEAFSNGAASARVAKMAKRRIDVSEYIAKVRISDVQMSV